eukprot:gene15967-22098_t
MQTEKSEKAGCGTGPPCEPACKSSSEKQALDVRRRRRARAVPAVPDVRCPMPGCAWPTAPASNCVQLPMARPVVCTRARALLVDKCDILISLKPLGAVKKADALPESTEKSEAAKLDDVGFMLHTDRRAMERTVLPERSTAGAPFPPERSPSTSATSTPNSSNAPLIMPSPPLTPSPFPPVGKRNISNQRGSNSLPVIRKTHMQLEGEEGRALRTSVSSMPRLGENGEIFVHPRVAEWRIRCHKARRRAILVVLTCIRLQRGLIKPNRLRRIDSFSFYIPIILSNETTRFIEEQRKFASIKKEISHLKKEICI